MVKIFTLKGKTFEELKGMTLEQFARLITSRERRTLLHGLTDRQKKLLENIRRYPDKFHKTHERDMLIIPEMVGVKIGVHKGSEFVSLMIDEKMIGHRLGEFALTRKRVQHSNPGVGATRSSRHIPLK